MNLRTSFALCLLFVVWVATCVFAYVTHEHRPCLTKYPGSGTGDCAQTSCHEYLGIYIRSEGREYTTCGGSEYYLNCEEKEPDPAICAVWYEYDTPEECADKGITRVHTRDTGKPSCRQYPWQP